MCVGTILTSEEKLEPNGCITRKFDVEPFHVFVGKVGGDDDLI